MDLFKENPAFGSNNEKLMLTNIISDFDDMKGDNLADILGKNNEEKEGGVGADFQLENEVKKTIFEEILYYFNLTNPKEWLFLNLFCICVTSFILLIDYLLNGLFDWRVTLLYKYPYFGVLLYFVSAQIFALIASFMGYFVSVDSDGSGIPEIKVVLSGTPMFHFYSFNTLFGKVIGIIFGIAAGLSIGRSGAYVHICCIIAKQLAKISYFSSLFNSQSGKSTIYISGCVAGFTLAFGTPLSAIIFSIEQTGTVYQVSNFWKSFYVSVCCIFVKKLFRSSNLFKFDLLENSNVDFSFNKEAILFIILAFFSGLFGALMNIVIGKIVFTRRVSQNKFYNNRFYYISIIIFIITCFNFLLPPTRYENSKIFSSLWLPRPVALKNIETYTQINFDIYNKTNSDNSTDLANTTTLSLSEETDQKINLVKNSHKLYSHPKNQDLIYLLHDNESLMLFLCFLSKYITLIISNTCNAPIGVIGPLLVSGTIFGKLYGHVIYYLFGSNQEFLYSMIGAVCFLSSAIHSMMPPILIFEMTGQPAYIIHLLFAALVSNLIGQSITLNTFDLILYIRKLPYLPAIKSTKLYSLTAKDIKENAVLFLTLFEKVKTSKNCVLENALDKDIYYINYNVNDKIAIDGQVEQETVNNIDKLQTVENSISFLQCLVLLVKIPENYSLTIPIIDKNGYIKFTFTAKKMITYIKSAYNKSKNEIDNRIKCYISDLIDYLEKRFLPPKTFYVKKLFNKLKRLVWSSSDQHKYVLEKYFDHSKMIQVLKKIKDYSELEPNSWVNSSINLNSKSLSLDPSFLIIEESCYAMKIQFLFTFLSLNNIFVTSEGKLVGLISKEEFIKKSMIIN